jgi:acyl-ACP thioesterase
MTSYWILLDRKTDAILEIGDEDRLADLKMFYENKLNKKTKMIKKFGQNNYKKDMELFRHQC